MEQETSIYHLVMEHQLELFFIGVILIAGFLLLVGFLAGRWAARREQKGSDEK